MFVVNVAVLNSAVCFSSCRTIKVLNKGSLWRNVVELLIVLLKLAMPLEKLSRLAKWRISYFCLFWSGLSMHKLQDFEFWLLCACSSQIKGQILVMEHIRVNTKVKSGVWNMMVMWREGHSDPHQLQRCSISEPNVDWMQQCGNISHICHRWLATTTMMKIKMYPCVGIQYF